MKSIVASFAAAGGIILVFLVTGAYSLWEARRDQDATSALIDAREMSSIYQEASTQVTRAELYSSLWMATGDSQYRQAQTAAQEAFEGLMYQIRVSPDPGDKAFSAWAAAYLDPLGKPFDRLDRGEISTFEAALREYRLAYIELYDSVRRGDLGDPALADQLVDPSSTADVMELSNPVTPIMAYQARRKLDDLRAAADANARMEDGFAVAAPLLYGAGGLLVIVLLAVSVQFSRRHARSTAQIHQLRRLSTTDPLTQLGNRRGFEEAFARLDTTERAAPVSLLLIDLDEFKTVNDTFGHARGDRVLATFADILSDAAPPGSGRFRIGGDEFAVILHGCAGADGVAVAETVRRRADGRLPNGVTISIGVATLAPGQGDATLLQQEADAALYEAKLRGRNVVVSFVETAHDVPIFPAARMHAVRDLLAEGRLAAVFQPIWDLEADRALGYEGLSRPHPDYGLRGPEEAFDIAEHFGRAADLDKLCRDRLLAAAQALPQPSKVFLNVSPYSLSHHSFSAAALLAEISEAGLDPARVVLEVTEKSQVPPDAIAEVVNSLRAAGLSVALDDVGSGNNGFEMLRKVPCDYVKIDRAVLTSAAKPGSGRAALMAILAFAAEAGALVIAEGVEDLDTFQLIQDIAEHTRGAERGRIHGVQGFLIGRPAAAEDLHQHAWRSVA